MKDTEADGDGAPRSALSVAQFCRQYGVGRGTAYQQIKNGRLRARKCGDRTLISNEDAERWLRALPAFKKQRAKGGRP